MVFEAIAGHDQRDSTSAPMAAPLISETLGEDIRGLRVGVPPQEHFVEGMDPAVRDAVEAAIRQMEEMGAEVDREVSLPSTDLGVAVLPLRRQRLLRTWPDMTA